METATQNPIIPWAAAARTQNYSQIGSLFTYADLLRVLNWDPAVTPPTTSIYNRVLITAAKFSCQYANACSDKINYVMYEFTPRRALSRYLSHLSDPVSAMEYFQGIEVDGVSNVDYIYTWPNTPYGLTSICSYYRIRPVKAGVLLPGGQLFFSRKFHPNKVFDFRYSLQGFEYGFRHLTKYYVLRYWSHCVVDTAASNQPAFSRSLKLVGGTCDKYIFRGYNDAGTTTKFLNTMQGTNAGLFTAPVVTNAPASVAATGTPLFPVPGGSNALP